MTGGSEVLGGPGVLQMLDGLPDQLLDPIRKAVFNGATKIRNDIINSMREEKHGREYRVPGKGKRLVKNKGTGRNRRSGGFMHTASAPGEAPAVLSSNLIDSIHLVFPVEDRGLSVLVGVTELSKVVYARRMEYGGIDSRGIYIAPRPYLMPAFKKNVNEIREAVLTATMRAVREYQKNGSR